jgi:hypothetical protein
MYLETYTTNKITKNKTLDKGNPPPLMVSYAPPGDEDPPFTFKQKTEAKKK